MTVGPNFKRKVSPEQEKRMAEMYQRGGTVAECAERFNCSARHVKELLAKMGIETRAKWRKAG